MFRFLEIPQFDLTFCTNLKSLERIQIRVMEKIEIKTIGVVITVMILLSFTQAQLNNRDRDICEMQCFLICISQKNPKPTCMSDCESQSHCGELPSNTFYNCITSCRLMKSIAINISMYSLKTFTYFHGFLVFLYI